MIHPVCNDKVWHSESHIVADNLVKNLIVNVDIRRFAFDDHDRFPGSVMYQYINTFLKVVILRHHFNGNEAGRIFSFADQVLNKILSDPFLGGKSYKLFPDVVKDHFLPFLSGDPE